jgi:hypothetical protein
MDHDYELASFERDIYDKTRLAKPTEYYQNIRPDNAKREDAARAAKQAARLGVVKLE